MEEGRPAGGKSTREKKKRKSKNLETEGKGRRRLLENWRERKRKILNE